VGSSLGYEVFPLASLISSSSSEDPLSVDSNDESVDLHVSSSKVGFLCPTLSISERCEFRDLDIVYDLLIH
jgi:hypothetical protein